MSYNSPRHKKKSSMEQRYKDSEDNGERVHNATQTQKDSYTKLNNEGQRLREKTLVYETLRHHQPLTSRGLSEKTGKERTNITRSIYDLLNEISPQVKIAFEAPCPVTRRRVQWYALIDWQPKQSTLDLKAA